MFQSIHRQARTPAITVERGSPKPLYRQIYERVRHGIAHGLYQPGVRLPSARNLASELGIARGTVEDAYGLLTAEGYIERHGQAGSVIARTLATSKASTSLLEPRAQLPARPMLGSRNTDQPRSPFQLGQPAFDSFPKASWSRLIARCARNPIGWEAAHSDDGGHPALKSAIARYLGLSRGIICAPDQILITNGYQGAIDLIGRSLLRPADRVWFEEPGYPFARDALVAMDANIVPVDVDGDGMRVANGIALAPAARLAVTTPAHQSPLCVTLSLPRRLQLLEWSRARGAWIVEDDYDGEFHYGSRPLPALKSLDRDDRVIYAGSFSKTLIPELRLGYLVSPVALLGKLTEAARAKSAAPARLIQAVVAEFLEAGHFARHLHRMRRLYAGRRQALADAMRETFGGRFCIDVQQGGMHLLARLPTSTDDMGVAKRACEASLALHALSATYMGRSRQKGILLSFTNVPESKARMLCRKLHCAIGAEI